MRLWANSTRCAESIGYNSLAIGFDSTSEENCDVEVHITTQSANIAQGTQAEENQGAGDQGLMFGYACDETEDYDGLKGKYFPLAAALSQRLTRRLTTAREDGTMPWARPDGKSQVTVNTQKRKQRRFTQCYRNPARFQVERYVRWRREQGTEQLRWLQQHVEHSIHTFRESYRLEVNGTGRSQTLVLMLMRDNRKKIIVDTYGGMGRRWCFLKTIKSWQECCLCSKMGSETPAAGLASKWNTIGLRDWVSIMVESFGTGTLPDEFEKGQVCIHFRPSAIAKNLNLLNPIYSPCAAGGHFGRDSNNGTFPWEEISQSIISELTSWFSTS